jgi:hypothetical protein
MPTTQEAASKTLLLLLRSLFCSLNQALWDPSLHNNLRVRISQVVPWKSQAPIMSYYPTQPFLLGFVSFVSSPSHTLSLSSLWLSTPVSQPVHIQLPFLNLFLWKSKWDSLFLPIITPAKQSFFFFFFLIYFLRYWEFGELFAKLSRSPWILHWKIEFSQFLNQKRQKSVRKPKKNQRQMCQAFSRAEYVFVFKILNFRRLLK